jgi:hypothetical protein
VGHGEDGVKVIDGQQLRLPSLEPPGLRQRLTRGTMAIATRNGELTITCLMESVRFWGVRAPSRSHTLGNRPVRRAVYSP